MRHTVMTCFCGRDILMGTTKNPQHKDPKQGIAIALHFLTIYRSISFRRSLLLSRSHSFKGENVFHCSMRYSHQPRGGCHTKISLGVPSVMKVRMFVVDSVFHPAKDEPAYALFFLMHDKHCPSMPVANPSSLSSLLTGCRGS